MTEIKAAAVSQAFPSRPHTAPIKAISTKSRTPGWPSPWEASRWAPIRKPISSASPIAVTAAIISGAIDF